MGPEIGIVDHRLRIRIVQHVKELIVHVPVVHVRVHEPAFGAGREELDIGRGIPQIKRHLAVRRQPRRGKLPGQTVRPGIQVRPAEHPLPMNDGRPLRLDAGDRFEKIAEIQIRHAHPADASGSIRSHTVRNPSSRPSSAWAGLCLSM